ncbi:MAG: hypothetical protein Q4C95_00530 [Planctomycetia bacterium]|nr:hypothetical protein [Planctomycetia bacterium]
MNCNQFLSALLFWTILVFFADAAENRIAFDFESGNLDQENWFVVEGSNTKPIGSRDQTFHFYTPYPKQGQYYLTLLEDTADERTHESNTCAIESPVFRPSGSEFTFMLGGGDIPETWLALCEVQENGDITELQQFRGKNEQTMDLVTLDMSPYSGKPLLFRFVDRGTGSWSYLHADDFKGVGTVDDEMTERRRRFVFTDILNNELESLIQSLQSSREMLSQLDESPKMSQRIENLIAECNRLRHENSATMTERRNQCKALRNQTATLARDIILAEPVVSEYPILYVSRPQYPYEHHNTETTYQTDDICTHLIPQSGSSLKLWYPKTGKVNLLLDVPKGIVRDPCIHFDGQRILVSLRWDINDDFHIYELDLSKYDSSTGPLKREDLTQLTYGPGLSDIDPQYLPDGRIVFSSSREPKYCMCNRHIMMNLHTMNGDGSNILQIGHSTLYEGHSSLLPDGRILYYRWEYVDRNFSDAEGVWTVNPDGTNHALFWGNNTESPAATVDPHVLPSSSSEFVCTMTACHISPWGAIGVIDRQRGLDGKEPVVQVWPQEAWDLIGTYTGSSYDNLINLHQFFEDPYPLDEDHFLAAGTIPKETQLPSGDGETDQPGTTGIWLLTMDGKMHLLHTDPIGCFDPMPLMTTEKPPIIIDRVDLTKETGSFYVTDVNEGFGMADVPHGMAKYLRIIESPEKRFWTYPSWWGVNALGAQQAPAMNWDDFGNKRILGIVPIEEDGSVYFTLPSDRFVYFQLLDENKEMIQSMRSGVIVRPGETNGCYGCHEDRLETPVSTQVTQAMLKAPQEMQLEFDREPFLFSYTAEIQPILDRYCVVCHDWPSEDSPPLERQAAEKVVLCGDLNPIFNCSYWEIRRKKLVHAIGSACAEKLKPLVWGARNSKLLDIMKNGHDQGGPIDQARDKLGIGQVDQSAREMTAAWIDLNAPYYPDFSTSFPNNPFGRSPLTFEETKQLTELTGYSEETGQMVQGNFVEKPLELNMSFTRPERSPCLGKWNTEELQKSEEYKTALALIQLGAERLKQAPREDMPGWKLTNPIEIKREEKYKVFQKRARLMQSAAARGEHLLDKDNQLPFEVCLPQ